MDELDKKYTAKQRPAYLWSDKTASNKKALKYFESLEETKPVLVVSEPVTAAAPIETASPETASLETVPPDSNYRMQRDVLIKTIGERVERNLPAVILALSICLLAGADLFLGFVPGSIALLWLANVVFTIAVAFRVTRDVEDEATAVCRQLGDVRYLNQLNQM